MKRGERFDRRTDSTEWGQIRTQKSIQPTSKQNSIEARNQDDMHYSSISTVKEFYDMHDQVQTSKLGHASCIFKDNLCSSSTQPRIEFLLLKFFCTSAARKWSGDVDPLGTQT